MSALFWCELEACSLSHVFSLFGPTRLQPWPCSKFRSFRVTSITRQPVGLHFPPDAVNLSISLWFFSYFWVILQTYVVVKNGLGISSALSTLCLFRDLTYRLILDAYFSAWVRTPIICTVPVDPYVGYSRAWSITDVYRQSALFSRYAVNLGQDNGPIIWYEVREGGSVFRTGDSRAIVSSCRYYS